MGLPTWIEVVPGAARENRHGSGSVTVTVPGSKSITNRALILAALARGRTTLRGALWSEDTQVMVDALRRLGFRVDVEEDPHEEANRTLRVEGLGGRIPRTGTPEAPLELFVGNAGTAARFLAAMVCLGGGAYRLHGVPRMHERPQAELFAALRELGHGVEAPGDRLPALIRPAGPRSARVRMQARESSQFASALILSGRAGGWSVEIEGTHSDELPYVEMTQRLVEVFPHEGGDLGIEPDASSGSYFWAADVLLGDGVRPAGWIQVRDWPESGWQADAAFPRYLPLPAGVSRATDLADSILTAMVLAPWAPQPVRFTDLGRLRVQECERVMAMREGLSRCGARVREEGDCLTVTPGGNLHGAAIETFGDHRIAMCFAVLGLRVPGIRLHDPGCVRKTFPNFFARLAAPPPTGPGVRFLDPATGHELKGAELLAG